jgi:hypothetical protein
MAPSDWLTLAGIALGAFITWTGAVVAYCHAVFAPKTDVVALQENIKNIDRKVTEIWEAVTGKE